MSSQAKPQTPVIVDGASPEAQRKVRLARLQTACLVVLALWAIGSTLAALRSILTPLLIALFLFYLIKPATDAVARWKISRWLVYLLILTVLLAGSVVLADLIGRNLRTLERRLPSYQERLEGAARVTMNYIGEKKPVMNEPVLPALLDTYGRHFIQAIMGTAFASAETLILVLFYLLYTFAEAYHLPRRIAVGIEPALASRYLAIGQHIDLSIKQFLWLKTVVNLGLSVSTAVLCYLFGLDFWLLWAVLMFLANYVTYVGSIVALLPTILMAFLQFDGLIMPMILASLLIVNRFAWIDYVEIRFLGKQLNLSPLFILFGIALFGHLWGAVGMLLAVPLLTIIKIVLSEFENTRQFAVLMSEA